MHILLTGATGYIGKRLLPILVEEGHKVTCCVRDVDRFNPPESIKEKINVIQIDLLEKEGKISYRALQREFEIDDETVDDIKQELVAVKQIARDIDGEMLELIPVEQPKTTQKNLRKVSHLKVILLRLKTQLS